MQHNLLDTTEYIADVVIHYVSSMQAVFIPLGY